MKIGVNCLRVDPDYAGGVNSYTLGLLEGFARLQNGNHFCLYVTQSNQHLFEKWRTRPHFEIKVIGDQLLGIRKGVCRAALLACSNTFYKFTSDHVFARIREIMDSEVDILYVPTVVLQQFNARKTTVLSMHDIQHVHYPQFFTWPRRLSRRITYGLSARYANFFQASSEFIKSDLLQHFPDISQDQVAVIPEGVNLEEFSRPREVPSLLDRYHLPERYLFYPAQLWPHKNHLTVLNALTKIEQREHLKIPLVMTGAKFSAAPRIFTFIAEQKMDYVHFLGKVPFEDLVGLYQGAKLLISAGLYESNSLPVLEAAAAGTPILASKICPNEELAQTLKLNLFDPLDSEQLAQHLLALWKDEKT